MKWVISELFYPDEVLTALIMTEIAEKFAKSERNGVICRSAGYEKTYQQQDKTLHTNIEILRVNILDLDNQYIKP